MLLSTERRRKIEQNGLLQTAGYIENLSRTNGTFIVLFCTANPHFMALSCCYPPAIMPREIAPILKLCSSQCLDLLDLLFSNKYNWELFRHCLLFTVGSYGVSNIFFSATGRRILLQMYEATENSHHLECCTTKIDLRNTCYFTEDTKYLLFHCIYQAIYLYINSTMSRW